MCDFSRTKEECLNYGCKSFKQDKCKPQKKKVKCKKLGKELDKDDDDFLESMQTICEMFSKYPGGGCKYSEKKGKPKCTGTVSLK